MPQAPDAGFLAVITAWIAAAVAAVFGWIWWLIGTLALIVVVLLIHDIIRAEHPPWDHEP